MEHVDIPDDQRHEPKGATAASAGQFLRAVGDGTTDFIDLSISNITDINSLTLSNISDLETLTIPFERVTDVNPAAAQANSTASTVAALVLDFNNLLAKLRTAGLMEP